MTRCLRGLRDSWNLVLGLLNQCSYVRAQLKFFDWSLQQHEQQLCWLIKCTWRHYFQYNLQGDWNWRHPLFRKMRGRSGVNTRMWLRKFLWHSCFQLCSWVVRLYPLQALFNPNESRGIVRQQLRATNHVTTILNLVRLRTPTCITHQIPTRFALIRMRVTASFYSNQSPIVTTISRH